MASSLLTRSLSLPFIITLFQENYIWRVSGGLGAWWISPMADLYPGAVPGAPLLLSRQKPGVPNHWPCGGFKHSRALP